MPGSTVIFLQHAGYEAAFQAVSVGITAASMGDQVYLVLAFEALRQYLTAAFAEAQSGTEAGERAAADRLGVPAPLKMLEDARGLGAKLIACDTNVRLCGFEPNEIQGKLDLILGLPAIWRLAREGRSLTF